PSGAALGSMMQFHLDGNSGNRSATWKAAENDCLERRNSIRPCVPSQDGPMAMRVTEMGASEGCPVIGQIEVASPRGDQITSPETELTSCWCSARELLRNRCMKQSK